MAAPSNSSSSSSFSYRWKYDVFISFRGPDTRQCFTGSLYDALNRKGIHIFIDDEELQGGEQITSSLVNAIEGSRIAIPVFSRDYASSSFCLDELVTILECIETKGRLVLPVFYGVDPSDVRHQKGSYGEALAKHKERFNYDRLEKWTKALRQAANLSGYHFKHGDGYEYEFIGRIVEVVSSKINRSPLHVAHYPVGLESQVSQVISLLDVGSDGGVHMIGIHGIGGMGKTTLARAIYNLIADSFEGICFLGNVRENSIKHGLVNLQEMLLSKIVGEKDIKLGDFNEGISIIKHRLCRKKVLLILDDVDELQQLRAIVGKSDWFGSGSRVIITTRDKHLLASHGVERTYKVKGLEKTEALELLSWNAFKNGKVDPSLVDKLNRAVTYASGLPLALEVIGSNLFGKRIEEWESALDLYERIPIKKIQKVLRVSFDALEENEQRVFLDIACCFKGYELAEVKDILRAHHDGCMDHVIRVLVDKSLINIDDDIVTLHDLIEDMGKEIVRQESPKEPGKRSRLWFLEDIVHVLEDNTGTCEIEIINLHFPSSEEEVRVNWDGEAFKKMTNLRTLIFRNGRFTQGPKHLPNSLRVLEWWGYPSKSLPSNFHPRKPAIIKLPKSCLMSVELLLMQKKFVNMRFLDFSYSNYITEIPDVFGVPNLEELVFRQCENLIKIHESVGFLNKLKVLDARFCYMLKTFPPIKLTSLEKLRLSACSSLESFPEILEEMENIKELVLYESDIKGFPFSIQNLTRLRSVRLQSCGIVQLPSIILLKLNKLFLLDCKGLLFIKQDEGEEQVSSMLSSILEVHLQNCDISDEFLHIRLSWFAKVKTLCLSENVFRIIPACIKEFHLLTELTLDNCKNLREIRGIPPNLESLSATRCTSLKYLDLGLLPAGIKECCSLRKLYLEGCENLQDIRGILPNIEILEAQNCTSLNMWCRSRLLNEKLHKEGGNKNFSLPGRWIPEWFEHCSKGQQISFCFRNKFLPISLCVIIASTFTPQPIFFPKLIINGNIMDKGFLSGEMYVAADHMIIFDLKQIEFEDNVGDVLLENEWNHVVFDGDPRSSVFVKKIGVRVFSSKSSLEDIQFIDPLLLNENPRVDMKVFQIQGSTTNVQGYNDGSELLYQDHLDGDSNSMKMASTSNTVSDQGYNDGSELLYQNHLDGHLNSMKMASTSNTVSDQVTTMADSADVARNVQSLFSSPDRDFLVRNNNDQVKIDSLKGKKLGIYFSASWCGPCRSFTPFLVEVYNEVAPKGGFEVIFVAADEDDESFKVYFAKMPWLAIPFSDSETRSRLDKLFHVRWIPHLVLLDETGKVVT